MRVIEMQVAYSFFTLVVFIATMLLLLSPWFFSASILRMVDAAARLRQRPVKFLLIDLFSLVFLIQLPYAIVLRFCDEDSVRRAMVLATFGAALMVLIWVETIKTVSRAGITSTAARAWISLLVIPLTYVGSFFMSGLAVWLSGGGYGPTANFSASVWVAAAELILLVLMIFSYFKTRQIVEKAGATPKAEDVRRSVNPFDD